VQDRDVDKLYRQLCRLQRDGQEQGGIKYSARLHKPVYDAIKRWAEFHPDLRGQAFAEGTPPSVSWQLLVGGRVAGLSGWLAGCPTCC